MSRCVALVNLAVYPPSTITAFGLSPSKFAVELFYSESRTCSFSHVSLRVGCRCPLYQMGKGLAVQIYMYICM